MCAEFIDGGTKVITFFVSTGWFCGSRSKFGRSVGPQVENRCAPERKSPSGPHQSPCGSMQPGTRGGTLGGAERNNTVYTKTYIQHE
jgi:hypothetical protein